MTPQWSNEEADGRRNPEPAAPAATASQCDAVGMPGLDIYIDEAVARIAPRLKCDVETGSRLFRQGFLEDHLPSRWVGYGEASPFPYYHSLQVSDWIGIAFDVVIAERNQMLGLKRSGELVVRGQDCDLRHIAVPVETFERWLSVKADHIETAGYPHDCPATQPPAGYMTIRQITEAAIEAAVPGLIASVRDCDRDWYQLEAGRRETLCMQQAGKATDRRPQICDDDSVVQNRIVTRISWDRRHAYQEHWKRSASKLWDAFVAGVLPLFVAGLGRELVKVPRSQIEENGFVRVFKRNDVVVVDVEPIGGGDAEAVTLGGQPLTPSQCFESWLDRSDNGRASSDKPPTTIPCPVTEADFRQKSKRDDALYQRA